MGSGNRPQNNKELRRYSMEWTKTTEGMPEPGIVVLACIRAPRYNNTPDVNKVIIRVVKIVRLLARCLFLKAKCYFLQTTRYRLKLFKRVRYFLLSLCLFVFHGIVLPRYDDLYDSDITKN
jgi:hypothetical protein